MSEAKRRASGTGSVQQLPSGSWRVRIRLSDGTRRSATVAASCREDAQRIVDAMVYELAHVESSVSAGPPTLRALSARFLDEREISKAAQAHERSVWRQHVLDPAIDWADSPITSITRADCVAWLTYLEGKKALKPAAWKKGGRSEQYNRALSRQTRVHCRNALRTFFEWALAKGFVRENPATDLPVRALRDQVETDEKWTYLSAKEIELVASCKAMPDETRDLFLFAIYTGMRQGELWALRWRNVFLDDEQPRVEVRRSHNRATKSRKMRPFPLLACAVEILQRQRARASHEPDDLVWPDHNGHQREEKTDAGWADRAGAKGARVPGWKTLAGITRRVRFHDLRHTCASHLVMGTWGRAWSLKEVSEFIGHADTAMTERYAHLSPEHLHRAAAETRIAAPPVVADAPTTTTPEPVAQQVLPGPEAANRVVAQLVSHDPKRDRDTPPESASPNLSQPLETTAERATGFEPATASLGTLQDFEFFRELAERLSHACPAEQAARDFLRALADDAPDAEQRLASLVGAAILQLVREHGADERLRLLLLVLEGGPFRWRRAIELASLVARPELGRAQERAR
jgi:integrase